MFFFLCSRLVVHLTHLVPQRWLLAIHHIIFSRVRRCLFSKAVLLIIHNRLHHRQTPLPHNRPPLPFINVSFACFVKISSFVCVIMFLYLAAPPVYPTQSAPPQTATYPSVMFPQPIYMPQQYPMHVPVSVTFG